MSVAYPVTKTLLINGAFLQEIKDSNPDLWSTFERLGRLDLPCWMAMSRRARLARGSSALAI